MELIDHIHTIVSRFKFGGPMPIHFDCFRAPDQTALMIEVSLSTFQRDAPHVAIKVTVAEPIPLLSLHELRDVHGGLEQFLKDRVEDLARRAWEHEFYEWLHFDSKRLRDPHQRN